MTSMVFLIETGKYDLAAHYLLRDIPRDDISKKSNMPSQEKVSRELRRRYDIIRELYPDRLTIEQMREIAAEAYEQVYQALLNCEYSNSLVYSENLGN